MRTVTRLELEKIGTDLCIVFRTNDSKYRGILGTISPDKLKSNFRVDGLQNEDNEIPDGFNMVIYEA